MSNKLKKPSDYPQIYFRIREDQKAEIDELVEQILELQLKDRSEDERLPKRNTVMCDALMLGLEQMKKKLKR